MLKIEEGKYYKTRDGRKVGPITASITAGWPWETDGGKYDRFIGTRWAWRYDGSFQEDDPGEHDLDLIAEWTGGPVVTETVTKTRIVPGVYGCIQVGEPTNGDVCVSFVGKIYYTPDELDAAAAVLSALAKGLRDA